MKKFNLFTLALLMVALFSVQFLPVAAQESETHTVSGEFNYFVEIQQIGSADGNMVFDGTEYEVWTGDFSGTGSGTFRVIEHPAGTASGWIVISFSGTLMDEYEGTAEIILFGDKPAGEEAEWFGRWMILNGTDDLANVHADGYWWGPASTNTDDGITDIFYSGEVMFLYVES